MKRIIAFIMIFLAAVLIITCSAESSNSVDVIESAYIACDYSVLPMGEIVEWRVVIEPDSEGFLYDYDLLYHALDDTSNAYFNYASEHQSDSSIYSHIIDTEGRYYLEVHIWDTSGACYLIDEEIYTTNVSIEGKGDLSETINAIAAECLADGNDTDFEIAKYMHDYLVSHADYDESLTYFEADGVLLHGTGVCQSYARAYQMLMRKMGIPCIFISGEANGENHSWNMIQIDGAWYHVDCTFDDPLNSAPFYGYFMQNDTIMEADHIWDRSKYPVCNQKMLRIDFEFDSQEDFNREMDQFFSNHVLSETSGVSLEIIARYIGDDDFNQDYVLIYYTNWKKTIDETLNNLISTSNAYIYALNNNDYLISINQDIPELPDEAVIAYADFEYQLIDGCVRIVRYVGKESHVVIPDHINGYPVTVLGSLSFTDCTFLESVQFPSTLTLIEDGRYGFPNYKPLSAFGDCTSLTSVDIPGTVKRIGSLTFDRCTSLSTVSLGEGIEEFGLDCFGQCPITSIQLPQSTTTLEQNCFYRTRITTVILPQNVSAFHYLAFNECLLTAIYVDDDNPYYDSDDGVLFTEGFEILLWYPMHRTSDLYVIPDTCTAIENFAFSSESQIKYISIPDSFDSLAFISSLPVSLESFLVNESNPFYSSVEGVLFSKDQKELLFYPSSRTDTEYAIPSGTETIHDNAFRSSVYLRKLTIPNSVYQLGYDMCNDSKALEEVIFESSALVTDIPDGAFAWCSQLREVVLPDHLQTMGLNSFIRCAIQNIELPSTVTSIGQQAFCENKMLLQISFPTSLRSLSSHAFFECDNLEIVYIPGEIPFAALDAFDRTGNPVTIVGVPGSFAENYALQAALNFLTESQIDEKYDLTILSEDNVSLGGGFRCDSQGKVHLVSCTLIITGDNETEPIYLEKDEQFHIISYQAGNERSIKRNITIAGIAPWHGTRTFVVNEPVYWPSSEASNEISLLTGMQVHVTEPLNVVANYYTAESPEGYERVNPDAFTIDVNGVITTSQNTTGSDFIYAIGEDWTSHCLVHVIERNHLAILPSTLTRLESEALVATGFEAIVLPESLNILDADVFSSCADLRLLIVLSGELDLVGCGLPSNTTVICPINSKAAKYCIINRQPVLYLITDDVTRVKNNWLL